MRSEDAFFRVLPRSSGREEPTLCSPSATKKLVRDPGEFHRRRSIRRFTRGGLLTTFVPPPLKQGFTTEAPKRGWLLLPGRTPTISKKSDDGSHLPPENYTMASDDPPDAVSYTH